VTSRLPLAVGVSSKALHELPSQGRGARGGSGAPLSREVGASAMGHAGMRARLFFHFDLELVRGVPGL
jgi:hypothetical protein